MRTCQARNFFLALRQNGLSSYRTVLYSCAQPNVLHINRSAAPGGSIEQSSRLQPGGLLSAWQSA